MNYKEIIKEQLVAVLKKDYPEVQNIEQLIEVKECKNLKHGDFCVSLHKFANALRSK
jgi:hypothetical protein